MKLLQLSHRDLVWLLLVVGFQSPALSDDDGTGRDTLRHYLDKSHLAIVAEVSPPSLGTLSEAGHVVAWQCKAKIVQVIKGDLKAGDEIEFTAIRFEPEAGDESPELTKGGKCILFLVGHDYDQRVAKWQTAGPWIGVMRYSPTFAKDLARVAKESKRKPR